MVERRGFLKCDGALPLFDTIAAEVFRKGPGGRWGNPAPTSTPTLACVLSSMRAAGKRRAELSGAESGMVASGAAGAIASATAGCMAGTDPAKIWQLPDTAGLKNEVIMSGRKHLIEAALANTSPWEGAACRAMKVRKEEVMGCLAAVEAWTKMDLAALNRQWEQRVKRIATLVKTVPGVTTEIRIPEGEIDTRL